MWTTDILHLLWQRSATNHCTTTSLTFEIELFLHRNQKGNFNIENSCIFNADSTAVNDEKSAASEEKKERINSERLSSETVENEPSGATEYVEYVCLYE